MEPNNITIYQLLNRLETVEAHLYTSKEVLTIDEAVAFTGKSKSHIYKLTSSSRVPHYKQGKHIYFDRSQLTDWLKENKVKTKAEIEIDAATYTTLKKGGAHE